METPRLTPWASRAQLEQHRGRLVDFTGDNFLTESPSALEAVRRAVGIQRLLGAMNADRPGDRRMEFRMGLLHEACKK